MSGPSGGGLVNPIYLINGVVNYTSPEAGTSGLTTNSYIPFTLNYPYAGEYGTRGFSKYLPSGNICVPGDISKLAPWPDSNTPTYGTNGESLTYTLGTDTFIIEPVHENDWVDQTKHDWLIAFMNNCGLNTLTNDSALILLLLTYWESLNGFALISGPSIAYVNKDFVSEEISVGMNVYPTTFFQDWANNNISIPEASQILALLNRNVSDNTQYQKFYISNACKITYKSITEVCWCFNGVVYNYDITKIIPAPSLMFGGGNVFSEIRLAGNNPTAHYLVKKFVHPDDPTIGLCSGVSGSYCIGDVILIIDNSTWSGTNGSGQWQFVGDVSQINYDLFIADIKNPSVDYKDVPASEMLLPLRVIQGFIFDDFD
jgi:hypothetical protein